MQKDQLAIDNCDKEPIHIPGVIQPFGCLLAGDVELTRIDYVSANVEEVLGIALANILGSSFSEILDRKLLHDTRNVLTSTTSKLQRERVGSFELNEQWIELFVHRNPNEKAVIELEPIEKEGTDRNESIDRMRIYLAKAGEQKSVDSLLKICVHGLRELTGYDRVKAYKYFSNGDGEVVAESKAVGIDSFLGLRYPAWDVPAQARALQVKNPIRMLSDIRQEPVALIASDNSFDDLDISLAHLRGVSPIHVEYLGNMGVGATLTIGLIVEGKLWGMFSCHHMSPKIISSDLRISVELFGQLISLIIQQKIEVEKNQAKVRAGEARRRILAETDAATDILHSFPELGPILKNVIQCDGVAVVRDNKISSFGSTPTEKAILKISQIKPKVYDLLESTDSIIEKGWASEDELNNSAGCLQIRCTAAYPLQLLFFRDEKIRSLKWAGKPQKDISSGKFGPRLTPRGSFEAYKESQKGYSDDWQNFDLEAGRELQILITQITTKSERSQMERHKDLVTHQRQQDLMIAELNHRVKNILTLIRSLSRQAKESSASLEGYAQALEQRISALAAAHDLAVSNTMQGVSLRSILETELQPYISDENLQVLLAGPLIGLRPDVAPMIALVIHEIVTNANKHGALSTPDGVVKVRWQIKEEDLFFSWQELNGPKVFEPKRNGFGKSLIEKAIPYEFQGRVDLSYPESGVKLDFILPAINLVELDTETVVKMVGEIGKIEAAAQDAKILLVEDNIVLAMDMVESLTRLGAKQVEMASSVNEALASIEKFNPNLVVLDMNLRGEVSFDVARTLIKQSTPFLFVTGYGSSMGVPEELNSVQILSLIHI